MSFLLLAVVTAALAPAAFASTANPDDQEPNDSPRAAYGPLVAAHPYYGHFNGPEADWFWFGTQDAGQTVHVAVENVTPEMSSCPVEYVTLVEPNGTVTTREVGRGGTTSFDSTGQSSGDELTVGLSLNGCVDDFFPGYVLSVDSPQPLAQAALPASRCDALRTRRERSGACFTAPGRRAGGAPFEAVSPVRAAIWLRREPDTSAASRLKRPARDPSLVRKRPVAIFDGCATATTSGFGGSVTGTSRRVRSWAHLR
jgi:hypothetical protein